MLAEEREAAVAVALKALERGDLPEAHDRLHSVWLRHKNAELGWTLSDLVELMAAPPIGGRSPAVAQRHWMQRVAGQRWPDLPALLELIPVDDAQTAATRYRTLLRWEPHPVTAEHLFQQFLMETWHGSDEAFEAACQLMARQGSATHRLQLSDPRQPARLARIRALRAALPDTPQTPEALKRLIARCRQASRSHDRQRNAGRRTVFAPRLAGEELAIYADTLCQNGDPHGELLALQLSEAPQAHHEALIDRWWVRWLGGLATVVVRAGLAFEATQLSAARLRLGRLHLLPRHAASTHWTGLHVLDGGGGECVELMEKVGELRRLERVGPQTIAELIARGHPRLEHLDLARTPPESVRNLPGLRSVRLDEGLGLALVQSPLWQQLERVELSSLPDEWGWLGHVEAWQGYLAESPGMQEVTLHLRPWRVVLTRGEAGVLTCIEGRGRAPLGRLGAMPSLVQSLAHRGPVELANMPALSLGQLKLLERAVGHETPALETLESWKAELLALRHACESGERRCVHCEGPMELRKVHQTYLRCLDCGASEPVG